MNSYLYIIQKNIGLNIIKIVEFFIAMFSSNEIIFRENIFESNTTFKKNWKSIRNEYLKYVKTNNLDNMSDVFIEQRRIAPDDNWKSLILLLYGEPVLKNQKHFPLTTKLINSNVNIKTAFFSVLDSGKKISTHRGPYKGLLRYHLGLIVPKSKECYILIDKKYYWKEGEAFIFDDTFEHEAQNMSKETRVVLFIDFIRPLPFPISNLNRLIVYLIKKSHFIQNVFNKLKT